MAKRPVLQSWFVQPKHLYPIMKPLKMLGCCQMACRWKGEEQTSLATFEACTLVMPLKVVVLLFWKQYTTEIWRDPWMENFGRLILHFLHSCGSKQAFVAGSDCYYRDWIYISHTHTHFWVTFDRTIILPINATPTVNVNLTMTLLTSIKHFDHNLLK